jgi:hypothetical protein
MKKVIKLSSILFAVLFIIPVPVAVNAADTKSLVIIDSYFDSRVASSNVSCVVVATKAPCTDVVKKFPKSLSDNVNHGNAMVEVAKKQSASLNIIALRSSPSPQSDVNAVSFIAALQWVDVNSASISAVSVSRFFNHPSKPCMPSASAPYTVDAADKEIKRLISVLKSKGIPVFVSTGNAPKKKVDYPACLTDTNSVTSPGNIFDSNTDFSVDLQQTNGSNFISNVFGLVPLTTSSATSAVAAQWVILNTIPSGLVKIYS